MTAAMLIAIAAAMIAVRLGWGDGASRRWRIAVAGWAVAVAALGVLAARDGAWGIAMGAVAGMMTAVAIVLVAGWRSPARSRRRPAREAPAVVEPHRRRDLLRRVAVFVLVVPGAFAAAQWLAFGAQALARRGGMGDADTVVSTLFLQPIAWVVLMSVQMTRTGAGGMIAPPVVVALAGTLMWIAS